MKTGMLDRRAILKLVLAGGVTWPWIGPAKAAPGPVRLSNGMYLFNNWLLTADDLARLNIQ